MIQAKKELKEEAELYEMDVTTTETWHKYNLTVTPTVLVFADGQLKKSFEGLIQKNEIIEALTRKIAI